MTGDREAIIAPTLACANRLKLKEELDTLANLGVTMLHLDVMDGHYVPNLCFDMDTIRQVGKNYPFSLDVHLMVSNPADYIEPLRQAGVEYVSFHLDASSYTVRLLKRIQECGMKGGIALNPSQPVMFLQEVLSYVSYVLVMGVEPGFSGQLFLPETARKIKELNEIRREKGLNFEIEVDGGIDDEGIRVCVGQGADILVSGAFGVFRRKKGLLADYLDCQDIVRYAEAEKKKGETNEKNSDID